MEYVLGKDDCVSLVMPNWHEGPEEMFEIVINYTLEVAGYIKFFHEVNPSTGNVEYEIFNEYRGRSYAKKALRILARNVSKLDYEDLYISILPDNIASIKTAVGAGALFEQRVEIPKHYIFSKEGKYKYANMYIIKNNIGVEDEKGKVK